MKDFKDKVLVITGAASGLGEAVAIEGAQRGMKLVLNDMNEAGLKEVQKKVEALGAPCVIQVADASVLETIQELYDLTIKTYGGVHLLMNNAGTIVSTPIWETPLQDMKWITEVNFLCHCYGLRIFLPKMIEQKEPAAVINVASAAALIYNGTSGPYSATKIADLMMAECTSMALRSAGYDYVQMHAFCPAYIQSNLYNYDDYRPERYADMSDPHYQSEEYKAAYRRNRFNVSTGMPIDSVGMFVFTCIEENRFFILTHPESLVRHAQDEFNLMNFKNPGDHHFGV